MRGVVGLIIGICLLVGALTGRMVLIGTQSSMALAVVAGILIVINLVRIVQSRA